jgi:uncharacterized protein (TIGR01244 family)
MTHEKVKADRWPRRVLRALAVGVILTLALAAFACVVQPVAIRPGDPALNYIPVSPTLATSGMPTRRQFKVIAEAGYAVVINLAPNGVAGAHEDEASLAREAGLAYHHVPVDFANPQASDYARLAELLRQHRGQRVLVHCQVSMRASSLVFLFRVIELGDDADRAFDDVLRIWQPSHAWRALLKEQLAAKGIAAPLMLVD